MTMVASEVKVGRIGNGLQSKFKITPSGNYVTGGDALDLTAQTRIITRDPDIVKIHGKAGYVYEYDIANKKVFVRQEAAAGGPAAELTAAAYPAGVTGDDIRGEASWYAGF